MASLLSHTTKILKTRSWFTWCTICWRWTSKKTLEISTKKCSNMIC
jgi:hypothetical protein